MKCPACSRILDLWSERKDLLYCYNCKILYHIDDYKISIYEEFSDKFAEYYPIEVKTFKMEETITTENLGGEIQNVKE